MYARTCLILFVAVALCLVATSAAHAATLPQVPRIMMAGDSWAMFMWLDRVFQTALVDKGFPDFVEDSIAMGGSKASQWAGGTVLANAEAYLVAHPSEDLVFMTLGGDDMLYGDPQNYYQAVQPPTDGSAPDPVKEAAFFDWIADNVVATVQGLTSVRPEIHVALCSYDYSNAIRKVAGYEGYQVCNLTTAQEVQLCNAENQTMLRLEQVIMQRVNALDRCQFVNNYGLMQYTFGYPGTIIPSWLTDPTNNWTGSCSGVTICCDRDPLWDPTGVDAFRFGPHGVTPPGQLANNYQPFAGGDTTFMKSPWQSLLFYTGQWDHYGLPPGLVNPGPIDDWIHLSYSGHYAVATHAFDVCLADWLNNPVGNPKVLRIGSTDDTPDLARQIHFEVMFDRPVTNVTTDDFELTGLGSKGCEVVSVVPKTSAKSDFANKYTVTVQASFYGGTMNLNLIDNDTITDQSGKVLGGPGLDNGTFKSGIPFSISAEYHVPVMAWPIAGVLLATALMTLKRRQK